MFLCNSGAEANEGACKIARKYSLRKYGAGRHTIVTLKGSFHGRTITTLAATGQERFHKYFGPFTEGFRFVEQGDAAALEAALDGSVCGLLIEAVQGESGVIPQSAEFIAAAAEICAKKDILLMFDEIQCGLGRTGTFFAFQAYGVKADIATLAKGLAGGLPVGACLPETRPATCSRPAITAAPSVATRLPPPAGSLSLTSLTTPPSCGKSRKRALT